nr:GntR family transcriptional regulator [Streptomyces pathocidini]
MEIPARAGVPEHGRVPKYYAVKIRLLPLLEELGPGAALPSQRELADRFGVSRETLRQALHELALEGRLRTGRGSRTVVAGPKLVQPFALASYTEGMREAGVRPSRLLVTLERLPAGEQLAADLRIGHREPVFHLERLLLADGERVGLESSYLPAHRLPETLDGFDPGRSLYAFLREELGIALAEAEERIETVLATPREALLIGTNPALPMLLVHRVSYDTEGGPVERMRALFRGDRFSFETRLASV